MSAPGGYSSESMLTGAGGAVNIVAMRGGAVSSSFTFGGNEYTIAASLDLWDLSDSANFLNYIGLDKSLFENNDIYQKFAEEIRNCTSDSSAIDSKCDAVNAILYKAVTSKLQTVFYSSEDVQRMLTDVPSVAAVAAAPSAPSAPPDEVIDIAL